MQVDTSGQHMSVGQSLNEYVDGRLKEVVGKYFSNAPSAHVNFSKQGHEFKCDIVLHEGTGRHVVIKSNNSSDEVYNAFDIALSKLEKQMRKYKSKLNNHHRGVKASELSPDAVKYVISSKNLFKVFLPTTQKKRVPSFVNLYSNIVRSFSIIFCIYLTKKTTSLQPIF